MFCQFLIFFFQAEDGIRDLVRSRGLGDVYKRQPLLRVLRVPLAIQPGDRPVRGHEPAVQASVPVLGQRTNNAARHAIAPVSYTHLRANETVLDLVCRLLLEKKTHYNI